MCSPDSAGGGFFGVRFFPVPPLRRSRAWAVPEHRQEPRKVFMEKNTGVTFADVAGVDEAKAELVEIVDFPRILQEYGRLGARIPRACCWSATGHRQDIAGQGCCRRGGGALFSISGSSLPRCSSAWVQRVRDLFEQARGQAPSSSSTSSMRWGARASAAPSAATTSASRPSTSCSRR